MASIFMADMYFGETSIPSFESTPKEGWDYWLNREYWNDIKATCTWTTIFFTIAAFPVFAAVQSFRKHSFNRFLKVSSGAVALVLSFLLFLFAIIKIFTTGIHRPFGANLIMAVPIFLSISLLIAGVSLVSAISGKTLKK